MVAPHSPPVLVQAQAPALMGVKATSALRDNQIVSLTAVGNRSGIANIGGAQPLPQQQTVCKCPMAATTTVSAAVSAPFREFRHEFDYNFSDDEGGEDDICELETMGAISLEGLEFDDPTADYDSIRQTVIFSPEDRAMLESFVHNAFISSTSFSSSSSSSTPSHISLSRQRTSAASTMHSRTTSTSSFFSNNRRSTSRSTRRHPFVIPHPNSTPYGHGHNHIPRASTSSRSSRKSGDTRDACFHLVSGGMNAVDLYGDGDGEGNEPVRHSTGDFGTRFSHHRKKSSGTLSYITHQPHPLTFPPQSYPRNFGATKGKFPAMNGTSGTILENEPARPDSPLDPIDS
ncbi:MAG: hypothetical protein J3R72DRAFT_432863 [Linnemannia gamsii]|nr:MAG: hypothetical protein J3R72DRAFT_432863 [Linnemannia gamsii]